MPSDLFITNPRPTAAPNAYKHTGRGGAGNTIRVRPKDTAVKTLSPTTPPAPTPTPAAPAALSCACNTDRTPGRFHTGVGGAGNVHAAGERAPNVSLDEEILRARVRELSGVGHPHHVGVGGAGNVVHREEKAGWRKGASSAWDFILKPQ
ncbi:hypothetical protein SODALDRAFT_68489 [Sodiomyces alkalinus F11]|uniref:Uncharacterized protein n=1 Tax=Sodiomyces alkalinus (strain CBS 110278 / VKM F-3762 / F11) TaxID=1314773 RepID=A0A3N2PM66_SODAK|nr:hypothetical protein SODALDRAFT_68489 [Sodiomyces alkalinus F11]ROT35510.1 hypothetical protein SODALDRAFT_68489 [Sodiomyces alkalinus F11]